MKNPYKVLGVDIDATIKQIKKAFRKKSMETHPDKGGSNEEFQEVTKAYEILATPHKRKQFDETGTVDEEKDNRQHINTEIANVFFAVLNQNEHSIQYKDIIKEMITVFKKGIEEAINIQAKLRFQIEKFEKISSRIENTKGEENIFENFVNAEIGKINHSIQNNDDTIKRLELATTIIETYKCEYEVRPEETTREQYIRSDRRRNSLFDDFIFDTKQ